MNSEDSNKLIGLVIGLILTAILLPIAINEFYTNPIRKTATTSLNTVNRTTMLLNGTDAGVYNGSILQPSFTNYTDIIYNTTLTRTENYTQYIIITCSNASAVNLTVVQVILNGASTADFNASNMFNTTFTFNTAFRSPVLPVSVIEVKIRFWSVIDSNQTISSNSNLRQYYTDDTTDTLNTVYYIIPLMAVIGVTMLFVKNRMDK